MFRFSGNTNYSACEQLQCLSLIAPPAEKQSLTSAAAMTSSLLPPPSLSSPIKRSRPTPLPLPTNMPINSAQDTVRCHSQPDRRLTTLKRNKWSHLGLAAGLIVIICCCCCVRTCLWQRIKSDTSTAGSLVALKQHKILEVLYFIKHIQMIVESSSNVPNI